MVRRDWMNLNGVWKIDLGDGAEQEILVPYPIESALSGVMKHVDRMTYRRRFVIPKEWRGRKVLLHFGAVDWEAKVSLNGREIGIHRGGFDAFSFDISPALTPSGEQELVVEVFDPTDTGSQPRGKQVLKPGGIMYTPASGIWQTVWLEPVSETHIESLLLVPDVDAGCLRLTVIGSGTVEAIATSRGKKIAKVTGATGEEIELVIPKPELWSPDSPHLYELRVTLKTGRKITDQVTSYFGMRKIALGKDDKGVTRLMLNGKFVFQVGPLDQGFWPDGIYTAPTDEALRYDIESIKQLGFNMSRKHLKVEPQRWYYWADKLGLLVWQDMPCSGDGIHADPPAYEEPTDELQYQFGVELRAMMNALFNHPAIVSWVVFNEGMGLQNSKGYDLDENIRSFMGRMSAIASEDKTRAINSESGAPMGGYQGWNVLDIGLGQVMDAHCYGTTKCLAPTAGRASVIGEYGYAKFLDSIADYIPLVKDPGISGLVWTQITDVENECNGLLTYDRVTFNENPEAIAAINASYCEDQKRKQ